MLLRRPKGADPVVESRARDQARWLIRDHGDQAEAVLKQKLRRTGLTPVDRHRYQLIRKELKRIRRHEPSTSTAVAIWQPRLFGADRLLRLFGVKAIDRRRRERY